MLRTQSMSKHVAASYLKHVSHTLHQRAQLPATRPTNMVSARAIICFGRQLYNDAISVATGRPSLHASTSTIMQELRAAVVSDMPVLLRKNCSTAKQQQCSKALHH